MNGSPNLEKLIQHAIAGDLDAFADVIRICQRPVRAWIVSRCPPGGDADEVAQKTFVAAFKRIDDYKIGTDFRAWLFTIARYQLMAESTRLKRIADYHSRYAPHALAEELARRSQECAEELPRLIHLRECLHQIRGNAREVLRWRYEQELPLAEIADRTGRSVGAIKKHLFMLRKKLHECIEEKLSEGSI